jgi:hypothetical protein
VGRAIYAQGATAPQLAADHGDRTSQLAAKPHPGSARGPGTDHHHHRHIERRQLAAQPERALAEPC